jgi:hypothetical protein
MKFRAWPAVWLILGTTLTTSSAVAATPMPCPPPQVSAQGGSTASTNCPAVSGASYSTNFSGTENPLSEGGKWVTGKTTGLDWNDPLSAGGKAYASVLSGANGSRYNDSIGQLSTSAAPFTPNQYAQGTVYLVSGYSGASHEVELLLHFSVTPHDAHGYEVLWGLTGYLAVVRWNGPLGNYTAIYDPGVGSMPIPKDGDVLRAQVSGNTLSVKLNGNTVATVDVGAAGGTVWSSGQPGIGFWPVDNAIPNNYGWKSFQAGNL